MASNRGDPFNNVEEGLKNSYFTVYGEVQNNSQIGLKYYAKIRPKRGIKRQVIAASLKQRRTLNQT